MRTMIGSSIYPFKVAQTEQMYLGALVADHPSAVVVNRQMNAPVITLTVATIENDITQSYTHQISYDLDKGWESILIGYATMVCIDNAFNYHMYKGKAQLDITVLLEQDSLKTSVWVGDTVVQDTSEIDTTFDTLNIAHYDTECYDENADLAGVIAREVSRSVNSIAKAPFTIKSINVRAQLYRKKDPIYFPSCWSIGR